MRTATEAIITLIVIIMALVLPLIIGMAIYKGYRILKPLPEVEFNHISDIDKIGDKFFLKSAMIGWIICGPIYWLIISAN